MKRIIVLSMIGFVLFVFGVYVFYTAWFEISSIRLVNSTRWTFVVGIVVCFIFNRFWGAHGFFHTFTHE